MPDPDGRTDCGRSTRWLPYASDAPEPISPELVLVDPDLARRARETLREPGALASLGGEREPSVQVGLRPVQAPRLPDPVSTQRASVDAANYRHSLWLRRRVGPPRALSFALCLAAASILVAATSYARDAGQDRLSLVPRLTTPAPAPAPRRVETTRRGSPGSRVSQPALPDAPPAPAPVSEEAEERVTPRYQQPTVMPRPRRKTVTSGPQRAAPEANAPLRVRGRPPTGTPVPAQRATGTESTPAFVLAWVPVEGALGYRVELFRGQARILRAAVGEPRIELPWTWRFESGTHRLQPGKYRWTVRPILERGSERVVAAAIVDSTWTVQEPRM